jgi:glc operon protein GlcG
MNRALVIAVLTCAGIGPAHAADSLDLSDAHRVTALAVAEAKRLNAPGGTVAVVDAGGHLVALERLDNTFPASAAVAVEKARTSAVFRKPTRDFENAVRNGRTSLVAVDVMLPLQGGVPLHRNGQVIGAIGVSGAASAQQDDDIAAAAASAFEAAPVQSPGSESPTFLDTEQVAAAFAKGLPLLENGHYKIHASRREAPGAAEIHERDTDILYVLEGGATFVTGGTLVNGKVTAQDEVRGASIDGGSTRKLAKGDVVVVPNGTPHWFKDVKGTLLYYVVKVTSEEAAARGTR